MNIPVTVTARRGQTQVEHSCGTISLEGVLDSPLYWAGCRDAHHLYTGSSYTELTTEEESGAVFP